jgi:hypothetical protein
MLDTIYIVNHGVHNIDSALDNTNVFDRSRTKIVPLTEGMLNASGVDRLTYDLVRKMMHFNENDALLISGHAILNMLAIVIALQFVPSVQILVHRKNQNYYEVRKIDPEHIRNVIFEAEQEADRDDILKPESPGLAEVWP